MDWSAKSGLRYAERIDQRSNTLAMKHFALSILLKSGFVAV
jgi:hypothetical protein